MNVHLLLDVSWLELVYRAATCKAFIKSVILFITINNMRLYSLIYFHVLIENVKHMCLDLEKFINVKFNMEGNITPKHSDHKEETNSRHRYVATFLFFYFPCFVWPDFFL
jgi:hypothetical protein